MNFFASQDVARKNTRKLVVLFLLAIVSLIIMTNVLVMAVFGYLEPERFSSMTAAQAWQEAFDWEKFLVIGAGVVVVVIIGSLYKIIALAGGGARVAEMLGGELIVDGTGDANKQKILNVVEEMAIASGTPVPPVYLLDEDGINAFAAGYTPGDAVIGVTRGAIEELTRDQLQGVVAHEFSHIFNGDMRLNIRLIGILHGILLLGIIGYYMLRGSSRSRSSKNGGGGIAILGLGLMVIGYAGTFFGNMIKAAVSRQREYLADASAVQFTRNPDGIAGALKRIGGSHYGSIVNNPNGEEISHAFFSQGIKTFLSGLYATHPPLDKRIRAIDSGWDGEYNYDRPETLTPGPATDTTHDDTRKTAAILATAAAVLDSNKVAEQVGNPTPEHLDYAHQLIAELPESLKNAAHEPYGARALIYFLALDKNRDIRDKQVQHLMKSADPGVYDEVIKLLNQVSDLKTELRLPLVDMALPTLRQLSKPQYRLFKENLESLIHIDGKVNLFEWSIKRIVLHHLDTVFIKGKRQKPQRLSLQQTRNASEILLSLLVYSGQQNNISEQEVFNLANTELGGLDIQLLPKNRLSLDKLNNALDDLVRLKPLVKPRLLKACATCITADKQITIVEAELFRAIADTLDCPMPPLIV